LQKQKNLCLLVVNRLNVIAHINLRQWLQYFASRGIIR